MALTQAQFQSWLQSTTAIRCILVEVVVEIAGVDTTLYLSNRTYNTGPSDTPANTSYNAIINNSLSYSQNIPIDGSPTMSWGDLSLDNTNGIRDGWLDYVWSNRPISIYIGDVSFSRDNFTKIYSGYVQNLVSKDRNTLNISIRDILQKLNSPITDEVVGGTGTTKDQIRPLVFGEVFNITPVLVDSANLLYMVHNGPVERIIEVRDNGVPLESGGFGYIAYEDQGLFELVNAPAGVITCSVQGERSAINRATGAVISHDYTTRSASWTRSGTTATVTDNSHGFTNGQSVNVSITSAASTIPLGVKTITVINSNSYSFTCLEPENLITYSEEFDNAAWTKSNESITANATTAPDGLNTADKLIASAVNSSHYTYRQPTLVANTTYTLSIYAKAAERYLISLWKSTTGGAFNTSEGVSFNLNTGTIYGQTGSLSPTIQNIGNGWYRCSITMTANASTTATLGFGNHDPSNTGGYIGSFLGDGTSGIYVWGACFNYGNSANTYVKNTASLGTQSGTLTISSYENTVAGLIQVIIQKYGATPLSLSEIDLTTFNSYDLANRAPVGLFINDTTNIIEVCQSLAKSLGSTFTANKTGSVTLTKLDLASPSPTYIIDDNYILEGSLQIAERIPVKGAIRLGYCKNWTVQNQLLTGIPEEHKAILSLEYLNKTVSDTSVLTKYNLNSEPSAVNTLLVSNTTEGYVTTEAQRLLDLWKTQRIIFSMELSASYLNINIGDYVYLTHYRFGLSNKPGQVVSVNTNWDTGRVSIGVLV